MVLSSAETAGSRRPALLEGIIWMGCDSETAKRESFVTGSRMRLDEAVG